MHSAGLSHSFFAVGDIAGNLQALAETELEPVEDVSAKLHRLLRLGYNRDTLIDAVRLFRELHWSTAQAEQGHGSAAVIHKYHKMYGKAMIAMRSGLHMARALFTLPQQAVQAARSQVLLDRLRRQRPESITGRHVFCGDLLATAKAQCGSAKLPQQVMTDIMQQHGPRYANLSRQARQGYEARAAKRVHDQRSDVDGRSVTTVVAIHLEAERSQSEVKANGLQHKLDNCRISEDGDWHDQGALGLARLQSAASAAVA